MARARDGTGRRGTGGGSKTALFHVFCHSKCSKNHSKCSKKKNMLSLFLQVYTDDRIHEASTLHDSEPGIHRGRQDGGEHVSRALDEERYAREMLQKKSTLELRMDIMSSNMTRLLQLVEEMHTESKVRPLKPSQALLPLPGAVPG